MKDGQRELEIMLKLTKEKIERYKKYNYSTEEINLLLSQYLNLLKFLKDNK